MAMNPCTIEILIKFACKAPVIVIEQDSGEQSFAKTSRPQEDNGLAAEVLKLFDKGSLVGECQIHAAEVCDSNIANSYVPELHPALPEIRLPALILTS